MRTSKPRRLISVTEANVSVAYDPATMQALHASLIAEPNNITITEERFVYLFPNGVNATTPVKETKFKGYLRAVEPTEFSAEPTLSFEIIPCEAS